MQAKQQPVSLRLYSLQGFQYCDLLLGEAERVVWATSLASGLAATDRRELQPPLDTLREVEQRAAQTLTIAKQHLGLLEIALDRLTLGRLALYRAILERSSLAPAREPLTAAVDGLRTAGDRTRVPWGLLTRAWLRFMEGDPDGAQADLDEAWHGTDHNHSTLLYTGVRNRPSWVSGRDRFSIDKGR